jgi:hypothetical protein
MGKGYAEGPAVEAAEEAREAREAPAARRMRRAVQGSTRERPERHFLGWADEVDADELFRRGEAFGIRIVELADDGSH